MQATPLYLHCSCLGVGDEVETETAFNFLNEIRSFAEWWTKALK